MRFTKDPDAVLDYKWDWSSWLAGDTITTVDLTIEGPGGLSISSTANDTTSVTAWLSGGEIEQIYRVVCHITTAAGRQDDRTIEILIDER